MIISALIERLEEIKVEEGDLPVVVYEGGQNDVNGYKIFETRVSPMDSETSGEQNIIALTYGKDSPLIISELIKLLEQIKIREGDLFVALFDNSEYEQKGYTTFDSVIIDHEYNSVTIDNESVNTDINRTIALLC